MGCCGRGRQVCELVAFGVGVFLGLNARILDWPRWCGADMLISGGE